MQDLNNNPTSFTFDLVKDKSPLIIGLDARCFSNTINLDSQPHVVFKRPTDNIHRTFLTYLVPSPKDKRLHLELVTHKLSTVRSLIASSKSNSVIKPLSMAKKVHRYTHARLEDLQNLFIQSKTMTPKLSAALKKVNAACEICASHGPPAHSRKVSISHINTSFNKELQIDFFWFTIKGEKTCVLNLTDTNTAYSEMVIAPTTKMLFVIKAIEVYWICRHGSPSTLSAGDEMNNTVLQKFLTSHNIIFNARPTGPQRHNKIGIVERKNGKIKRILERIESENTNADKETILSRAVLLSNMFSGSKILSSFELARGYSPSLLGIPQTIVKPELLEAHKEQIAIRALEKLLKSRKPNTVPQHVLSPGTSIWAFHKTSKQNEKPSWVRATVTKVTPHVVYARRSSRGPPMRVAYEDLRIAPTGNLTTELLSCSLEDELSRKDHDETSPERTNIAELIDTDIVSDTINNGTNQDIMDTVRVNSEQQQPSSHNLQGRPETRPGTSEYHGSLMTASHPATATAPFTRTFNPISKATQLPDEPPQELIPPQ